MGTGPGGGGLDIMLENTEAADIATGDMNHKLSHHHRHHHHHHHHWHWRTGHYHRHRQRSATGISLPGIGINASSISEPSSPTTQSPTVRSPATTPPLTAMKQVTSEEGVWEDERDLHDPLAPPPRLLEDARRKLGETFEMRHAALAGLKNCIDSYNETVPKAERIEFMRRDDWFLMSFLRCKKFHIQRAFDEFLNYSTFHYKNNWLRDGVDRDLVRRLFSSGAFQVLPTRDPSGKLILSLGTKALVPIVEELGPSKIMEIVKAFFFLLEVVVADIETQIFGAAIVGEFSACKIKILTYLSPSEYQMCLHLCQSCYPLRASGMYIIREPWYMRTVWAIIRPFMNTKVKRRFKTFGKDWGGIYEYIPRKSLTSLYGGDLQFDAEAAAKRWIAAVDALIARG